MEQRGLIVRMESNVHAGASSKEGYDVDPGLGTTSVKGLRLD